jgi:hypothetical protein
MVDMTNRAYNDPDDFLRLGDKVVYPCDTQYMVYNPLLRRYILTPSALIQRGADVGEFKNDELKYFLEKVSKKVYDYIQYKAGRKCYEVQTYRIAVAPKTIYPSQYAMRKQFEEALIYQALYLIANGDPAEVSTFNMDGKVEQKPPEETWRDTSDMSPECIRTLDTLGLTKWFTIGQFVYLDESKY